MTIKTKLAVLSTALIMGAGIAHADSIKIGINVPLTGFAAADGKSALTGAELAVSQANAAGALMVI